MAAPVDLEATALPAAEISRSVDLERIMEAGKLLLSGNSLNRLNRQVLEHLVREASLLAQPGEENAAVSKVMGLREWGLFVITNQNYCSPTRSRENAVFHDGVVKISDQIRYLRSEINCPVFEEPYERNVVAIRARAADSFANLAARYVTCSASRLKVYRDYPSESFEAILAEARAAKAMVIVNLAAKEAGEFVTRLTDAIRTAPAESGAFYLRIRGTLGDAERSALEKCVEASASPVHLVIEEDYNPLGSTDSGMRRATLVHNQKDQLRYQLIQDAASMGYRIGLADVVRTYFEAGRLSDILNTATKSEDCILRGYRNTAARVSEASRAEEELDYGVLLNTLSSVKRQLAGIGGGDSLESAVLEAARAEAQDLERSLRCVLTLESAPLSEVIETFHAGSYRLRTLVQYAARLSNLLSFESRESLEGRIASIEGGEVVATKSGMSAARAVITHLGDKVDRVYTGPHYWETDFLIENSFAKNPHYSELSECQASRVTWIPHDADQKSIERHVEELVSASASMPNGQMVCLDKSIAPFFYTRSFDLEHFARALGEKASGIQSPIYFVVDNTLDLKLSPESLFPAGLPRNVFLIFTPSHAKLHQLGFDFTTGGMIEIHSNPQDTGAARALRDALEAQLGAEDNLQDPYALRLLLATYYDRSEQSTFSHYYSYMIDKRQRNTRALMQELSSGLRDYVRPTASGEWECAKAIEIPDPERPEVLHRMSLAFHYDPKSSLHAYIRLLEPPTDKYMAGRLFEEMKRRVFKIAASEGIQLGDGTSWGFQTTRLDWYMHTLRVAVGVEHAQTLARLGAILSSVLKEFVAYPHDFLARVEATPMYRAIRENRIEEIMKLDRLIPQDRVTPSEYYAKVDTAAWDYSFVVENKGGLDAMLLAWPEMIDGERCVYLSKAATAPEAQGKGYFRRMLEHLKDNARVEGISRVALETSASEKNIGVVRAYERCGFEAQEIKARMMSDGWPLIKVRMVLDLNSSAKAVPFTPVPNSVYERVHESLELGQLAAAVAYPVKIEAD